MKQMKAKSKVGWANYSNREISLLFFYMIITCRRAQNATQSRKDSITAVRHEIMSYSLSTRRLGIAGAGDVDQTYQNVHPDFGSDTKLHSSGIF